MNQLLPHNILPKELEEWMKEKPPKPLLIDVREADELSLAPFPAEVVHLPLSQPSAWMDNLPNIFAGSPEQPVVVICHSGVRSGNFGLWLLEQGLLKEVWNLQGGIDLWSIEVDSSVPRY